MRLDYEHEVPMLLIKAAEVVMAPDTHLYSPCYPRIYPLYSYPCIVVKCVVCSDSTETAAKCVWKQN